MRTLRALWKLYQSGNEESHPDYGRFEEYGLGFDYVSAGTFNNKEGYFRVPDFLGGPSEEFRFYTTDHFQAVQDYLLFHGLV